MALTPSAMLPLGTPAPAFNLLNPKTGEKQSLQTLAAHKKATVILFICNHCPYVKHIKSGLIEFSKDYAKQAVAIIAINANDVSSYPEDAPEKMIQENYPFPYLFDETQEVARAYHAACTPDCYIFDNDLNCVYRGRFDSATPGNLEPVSGKDLREALDAVLAGKKVKPEQYPSMGCNIKWK